MKKERIKVYIKIVNGKTVCICTRGRKGCREKCDKDIVERDPCRDWEDDFHRDIYGQSKK